jgi:ABC-type polysaccharide/polyol phosphate transport system ATPase subunit
MRNVPAGAITAANVTKVYRVGEPRSIFSFRAVPSLFRRPDAGRMVTPLSDVSFHIEPGESVGLIGPNGTGKSTLLRILTGITAATRGSVATGGRIAGVLDLGSGFYDELSAYHNTFLNAQLLGMTRQEVERKFDEIFAFAELQDFVHAPVSQFSFGMRLRLAFSIAMALEPDILLLDEVMGVGDLAFQRRSAARIRALAQKGVTLIVVSHHLSDLTRVCRRGILLQRGHIAADGPIQQTIDTYLQEDATGEKSVPTAGPPASGRLEITAVDVLGESGREQLQFHIGEAITLRAAYRTERPIDKPVISFGIYREDGLYLGLASTETAGYHTGRLSGKGEFHFQWECPFTAGGYRITATIADSAGKTVLAQAHSAAGFEVLPRPGFDHGAVRIDGHWSSATDPGPASAGTETPWS